MTTHNVFQNKNEVFLFFFIDFKIFSSVLILKTFMKSIPSLEKVF